MIFVLCGSLPFAANAQDAKSRELAAALVAGSHFIPLAKLVPMFVLYCVLYAMIIPSYIWAKREHRNS